MLETAERTFRITYVVKKGAKLMLLPQRPYIPIGTLRRAATYPDAAESRDVKEIAEAFKRVGLAHLVDRIEDEAARERQESLPEVATVLNLLPEIVTAPPEATVFQVASSADAFAPAFLVVALISAAPVPCAKSARLAKLRVTSASSLPSFSVGARPSAP